MSKEHLLEAYVKEMRSKNVYKEDSAIYCRKKITC